MTGETGRGIDPAVDLVLGQVISQVRQCSFRGIFELVARFELLFVRMAVGAEGFRMTDFAGLLLLRGIELVLFDVIRPVAVVQCRPPIAMTITAQVHARAYIRMFSGEARSCGTGEKQEGENAPEQGEYE
jgi:hypothetical protein